MFRYIDQSFPAGVSLSCAFMRVPKLLKVLLVLEWRISAEKFLVNSFIILVQCCRWFVCNLEVVQAKNLSVHHNFADYCL